MRGAGGRMLAATRYTGTIAPPERLSIAYCYLLIARVKCDMYIVLFAITPKFGQKYIVDE